MSLHVCAPLSAPGLGPAEVMAAAFFHLVCFGSYISQLICLLFLLRVLSLLASGASLSGRSAETAPSHCHRRKKGCEGRYGAWGKLLHLLEPMRGGWGRELCIPSAGRPVPASASLPLWFSEVSFITAWEVMGVEGVSRCSFPPFLLLNHYGTHKACEMTSYFKNRSPEARFEMLVLEVSVDLFSSSVVLLSSHWLYGICVRRQVCLERYKLLVL